MLDAHPACSLIKSNAPTQWRQLETLEDSTTGASLGVAAVAEVVGGVVEGVAVLVEGVAAGQPVPTQGRRSACRSQSRWWCWVVA